MKPRLDQVRPLQGSGYLLTWEDGFELAVGDALGLDLLENLNEALRLRAEYESTRSPFGRLLDKSLRFRNLRVRGERG